MARLRAVFTPQVVLWMLAAFLLLGLGMNAESGKKRMTDLEAKIGRTLSGADGAGKVEVVLKTKPIDGKKSAEEESITGAIAVVEGADNPLVSLNIQDALCALLGLPASAVSVLSGGK